MSSAPTDPARFRGRALDVQPGEPLGQALVRRGSTLVGRASRFHRRRAPFCGTGACTQCLVRVDGQPIVRGCRYRPSPGDRIDVENAWPSPRFDLLGALDLLFYRGLDTHHGFRRPRAATPLFQRVVRRLAGVGRLADPHAGPRREPAAAVESDVAVIGGGHSGTTVAARLRAAGQSVFVIDRGDGIGGTPAPPDGARGYTAAFLPPPTAGSPTPFTVLASRDDGAALKVRARRVVVATGGYDAGLLFDGNDRPGVMTGDGAEAFTGPAGRPPFAHAILVGGGARVAELLERFGPHVDAVVAPGAVAPEVADRAARLDVPLYPRTLLVAARGARTVRGLLLRPRGGGAAFRLAADAIVLAHRRLPNAQLFFQSGARMEWRNGPGAYYPVLGAGVATSVEGLFAVGEAAGFTGDSGARASGETAVAALLGEPAKDPGPRVDATRPGELLGYLRELRPFLLGRRRPVLCSCEDLLLREVEEAHAAGYLGLEVVKRYTGVGTGLCQGRYCLPDTLLLLAILEERSPASVGYITQRPPVFPAPLDALARLPLPVEPEVA